MLESDDLVMIRIQKLLISEDVDVNCLLINIK